MLSGPEARAQSVSTPAVTTGGPRLMAVTPNTPRFQRFDNTIKVQDQLITAPKKLNRRTRPGQ